MRITRAALPVLVLVLLLTACGSGDESTGTPAGKLPAQPAAEPAAPSSDFALPVTAPMRARDRLLHDLRQRNNAARHRARQMDQVIEQNR